MDSLMFWRLENRSRIHFKPERRTYAYLFWYACMSFPLSLNVALQSCGISGHINLNPRVSSMSAKVPLHVWSCAFMFICPSRAPARAKGEYESSGWHWGDLWQGLLIRLLFIQSVFFPVAQTAPISWLLLCTLTGVMRQNACPFSARHSVLNSSDLQSLLYQGIHLGQRAIIEET